MEFKTFVRKPFKVTALQVTEDNLSEMAEMIGDGRIRRKDNGALYFLADKRMIRSITRVEIGYWVTKLDDHFRVYKPSIFDNLFLPSTSALGQLMDNMMPYPQEEAVIDGV